MLTDMTNDGAATLQAEVDGQPAHISPAWLARPVHSPERRYFSVLCWRGYCDHEFKRQAIAYLVSGISGAPFKLADLPVRTCPIPAECECECHDKPKEV